MLSGRKLADQVQQFIGGLLVGQEERTDDPIVSQVCLSISVCVHVYMFVCVCVCVRAHACMHMCVCASMHVCVSLCIHPCMRVCVCASMHACMHVCVSVYVHVCVWCFHVHTTSDNCKSIFSESKSDSLACIIK